MTTKQSEKTFAVAINVDPEILLVDEALAVGDIYFRQRCMRKVHELRSRGITILFVSHAVSDVKAIGDRAMWLDHGRLIDHNGYHCRDYFLKQWDRFRDIPGGVLAHSTHLRGLGTYDVATGIDERPLVKAAHLAAQHAQTAFLHRAQGAH